METMVLHDVSSHFRTSNILLVVMVSYACYMPNTGDDTVSGCVQVYKKACKNGCRSVDEAALLRRLFLNGVNEYQYDESKSSDNMASIDLRTSNSLIPVMDGNEETMDTRWPSK